LEAVLKSVGRSPSSQLNSLAPFRASGISGMEQEEIPNLKTAFGANLEREQTPGYKLATYKVPYRRAKSARNRGNEARSRELCV
jgi:hypothetical protein